MRSLTFKLTLSFLLVSLTGSILVAVFTHQRTRSAFDRFIVDQGLQVLKSGLEEYYLTHGNWDGLGTYLRPPQGEPLVAPGSWRDLRRRSPFTLVSTEGIIVYCNDPARLGQPIPHEQLEQALALQVNGDTVGWLVVEGPPERLAPLGPEQSFLREVNRAALLSALVAGGLALLMGSLLALGLTRNLRELTEAAGKLAQGQLGLQVNIRSTDEMGALATAFNRMSADLQRLTQARRQMTADIAHDLRSPLSVISGYAEALNDGKLPGTPEVYAVLHQEALRLNRLVEDLRLLSLADAGELRLERQPADLGSMYNRLLARHAIAAGEKGIRMQVEVAPDLPQIVVDVERLAQVLDNLVLNAFRHTPTGGEVRLSARRSPPPAELKQTSAAEGVLLQVRDTGPGIAAEDLPFIFERFYRGDRARPHTGESGLGLAISRSIVQAHGGVIWAENHPQGGALFSLWLPLQPPS